MADGHLHSVVSAQLTSAAHDVNSVSCISPCIDRCPSVVSTTRLLAETRSALPSKFSTTQEELLSRYGVRLRQDPRRSRSAGHIVGSPAQRPQHAVRSMSLADLQRITRPCTSAESELAARSPGHASTPPRLRRQTPPQPSGQRTSGSRVSRVDGNQQGADDCIYEGCHSDDNERDADEYDDIDDRGRGARKRRPARAASSFVLNQEEEVRKQRERKRLQEDASYMHRRTADIRQQAVREKVVAVSRGSDYLHDSRVFYGPYSLKLHLSRKEAKAQEDTLSAWKKHGKV